MRKWETLVCALTGIIVVTGRCPDLQEEPIAEQPEEVDGLAQKVASLHAWLYSEATKRVRWLILAPQLPSQAIIKYLHSLPFEFKVEVTAVGYHFAGIGICHLLCYYEY